MSNDIFDYIISYYKPGLSKTENNKSDTALTAVFDAEGMTNYKERIKLRAELFALFDSL